MHDSYGLPRCGFYFEGGIWKSASVLKGRQADEITLEETELGLREYVKFKHAKLPRAKVIEGILGIFQNEIEPLPGYVGRDERNDKFERVQKKLLEAGRGKIGYRSFLLSKERWIELLEKACEKYNLEPQGGRLKGLSPREAYEQGFDYASPLVRLGPATRYLLANHRRRERVTKNGVRIVWGGEPFYYRNAETGRLIGREVLVWHDVEECPQSITLTDLNRQNAVEVPRVEPVPAMSATSEQIDAAMRQNAAHNGYAKTLYRIIEPRFARNMFRAEMTDGLTVELGQKINAGRAERQAEEERQKNLARRISAKERELGLQFTKPPRLPERKLRGLDLLKEADRLDQLSEDQEK